MSDNRPVGMFDSGFGGLTVLAQMKKKLPQENVIYFGDNARAPYGPRSGHEIVAFNHEISQFMMTQNVKAIIMACNTSTSYAIDHNRGHFDVPFISLIDQGIEAVPTLTRSGTVAVIATQGTVNSDAFGRALHSKRADLEVLQIACPQFVPIIESGRIHEPATRQIAREYLAPALERGADVIILGCTHYPFLLPVLREIVPAGTQFVDPAVGAVEFTGQFLQATQMRNTGEVGQYTYLTSGDPATFATIGAGYLGFPLESVRHLAF